MGEAHFHTPTPPKPLNQLLRSPHRVDVQNLVRNDSAVMDLRMREKHVFVWIFLLTYLSVYISIYIYLSNCPFLRRGYRSQFWGNFQTTSFCGRE